MNSPVEVAAALIRQENTFLICRRPMNKARGGLWEFVGGKWEKGETGQQALIRECREELAVTVKPESIFYDVIHEYPDITIHLTVYNASIVSGTLTLLEHSEIKWIRPDEIDQYEFCPADVEILAEIRKRF